MRKPASLFLALAAIAVVAPACDPAGSPIGELESVEVTPTGIRVRGWALDEDAATAVTVRVASGTTVLRRLATIERPDVAARGHRSAVGYSITLPITAAGRHRVCVAHLNLGPGADVEHPCREVVRQAPPFGRVDGVSVTSTGVRVRGWAIDHDTADPVAIGVNVGGVHATTTADLPRPDVAERHPGFGRARGFDFTVPVTSAGSRSVCVYAVNVGPGSDRLLQCRDLHVSVPFGRVEAVAVTATGVRFTGWAVDPDTSAPISVQATIGGLTRTAVADRPRPDVAAAHPAAGEPHGFDFTVPHTAAPGLATFTVKALNTGPGWTSTIGTGPIAMGVPRSGHPSACAVANGVVGTSDTVIVGGIRVHRCLAPSVQRLLDDAKAAGITFGGWGWRDYQSQMSLRVSNKCPDIWVSPSSTCSPPTARPGQSMHERATAIDFTVGGAILRSGSPAFAWLQANAARYGLFNLPSEPWHWSTNGH